MQHVIRVRTLPSPRRFTLLIDLEIDCNDAGRQDDKYVFFCSDDPSLYSKSRTVRDDHVPDDEFVTLAFSGLFPDQRYSLDVYPGGGGEHYRLLDSIPLEDLLSGRYKYAGSGEDTEPRDEDDASDHVYDESEDAELPGDDESDDQEQWAEDWEPQGEDHTES